MAAATRGDEARHEATWQRWWRHEATMRRHVATWRRWWRLGGGVCRRLSVAWGASCDDVRGGWCWGAASISSCFSDDLWDFYLWLGEVTVLTRGHSALGDFAAMWQAAARQRVVWGDVGGCGWQVDVAVGDVRVMWVAVASCCDVEVAVGDVG